METLSQQEAPRPGTSNPLFEQLFTHLPDAILVTDSEGKIIEANKETERLFGYKRAELLGQPVEFLLPERFREKHVRHRGDYARNPRTRAMGAGLSLYGLHKDGSEIPVDIMLSPSRSSEFEGVIAVVRDVTQRKRMEEALWLSEEKFKLLIDGARDYAIFLLDPNGFVATWNPGAERIKGYKAEEIKGRHFSVFYPQEDIDQKKPEHELEIVKRDGRHEDEGWRIRKDGSRFWANAIITALYNEKNELVGFSKVTRDLTNRKKAEDALLLELSSAVLTQQDIGRMLSAIAGSIRQLVPCEYANLALFEAAKNRFRVYGLIPEPDTHNNKAAYLPLADTAAGSIFASKEPVFADPIESDGFAAKLMPDRLPSSVRSGCWLPLGNQGEIIGTLFIGGRQGAFEDIDQDMLLRAASQIALAIEHADGFRRMSDVTKRLVEEKRYLEEELRTEYSFDEIVGDDPSLKRILKQVETVAPTDATVLILGETGTGKELIARAIHNISTRRNHTFVKLNCSAIPLGLLESELFGHEKGAFTGAIAQRVGRLELAHQGTLFLDEIGDLPLDLQPKLLRALQEKEIERLGGKKSIPVDFRLLAATHHDLARMVKEGQFRSDLYYRLKVFPILIPPLRQRKEDIPLLVDYFVAKHARRMNKYIEAVPDNVMIALSRWHWPGNIRELENFIERAVILSNGPELRAPLGELELPEVSSYEGDTSLETKEREHILQVLRGTGGVIAGTNGAAAKLGLKRTTLNSRLRKLGIQRKEYIPNS